MDELEEVQQNNMISNLPLLFANGYPTSLEKITESQLENFIPFMVQCSLGHINLQGNADCSEPEWWPEDLPFTIPFCKPRKFIGNWMEKMKEVVLICYQFHKSVFLLRFCNDLASYEHASLRFINNYNSTTSLFDRRSNKLLVTFRNENMSYDQPQRSRKCLLQQKSKNGRQDGLDSQQMMVEPPPFDIYLCDNCDAELYLKEAILEHEKTCSVDDEDDDVILCDTPEPQEIHKLDVEDNAENNELRIGFLFNFNLQYLNDDNKFRNVDTNKRNASPTNTKEDIGFMIVDRNKRISRRNRAVHSLSRCPTIPLSSPAGQLLLRTTKTVMTPEYLAERLDRMERFCQAPLLMKSSIRPKYLEKKYTPSNPHITFKKPQDYSAHVYVFPRRQYSQRRRTENFLFLNSPLIKRCRPISVRLKKITECEMQHKRAMPSTKLNIKLTRDTTRSSNWKISSPSTEIIVDTIDLCSSDDDDNNRGVCVDKSSASSILETHGTIKNTSLKAAISPQTGKVSFSRTKLRRMSNRFNPAEVSLIPIQKTSSNNCTIKCDKANMSSPQIKIVASKSNDNTSNNDRSTTNSHYEGNIVLSPPPPPAVAASESAIALPKPLRPSVYIFSNYTNNPLTALVTTTNEILPSTTDNSDFRSQNQENRTQGAICGSVNNKHSHNSTSLDWFPSPNNLITTTAHSSGINSNNNQTRTSDRDRPAKNLSLVQSYGSPNRVISIDLTS